MPKYTADLSAVDNMMPMIMIPPWLVFKVDPDAGVAALRSGLDKTVAQYPWLSGEVYTKGINSRAKIDWSDENPHVEMDEVVAPEAPSYDELVKADMDLHRAPYNLLSEKITAAGNPELERKPVLLVAYTKLDGGLIVQIALHHGFVDGGGLAIVYNLIAANVAGRSTAAWPIDPQDPLTRVARMSAAFKAVTDAAKTNGHADANGTNGVNGANGVGEEEKKKSSSTMMSTSAGGGRAMPKQEYGLPTQCRLFRFSVKRLDALRQALRPHTKKPFSINTLVTAYLWVLLTSCRVHRLSAADPANWDPSKYYSEMGLAVNTRKYFEQAGIFAKNSWLGNIPITVIPTVRIDMPPAELPRFDLSVNLADDGEPTTVRFPAAVPAVMDALTDGVAAVSAESTSAFFGDRVEEQAGPDFDFSLLRDTSWLSNGIDFVLTNWGSLDLLPNFGPLLGRPQYMRSGDIPGFDGVALVLPRYRGDDCSPEMLDRFDVNLILKESDMPRFQADEVLAVVARGPPL